MDEYGDYPDANPQLLYLTTIFEWLANTRRCLNFSRSGGILPLPVLAFLAVQTHRGPEHDENIHDPFVCFGQAYAAPWPSTGPRSTHYETSARWMLRILYHTRCFVVTSRVLDDSKPATSSLMQEPVTVSTGLKLDRGFAQSSGSFPLHGRTLCIEEVRAAIVLTQELDPARPLFSIICLSDSDQIFSATRKLRDGTDDRILRMWPEVLKGQGLAGINAFQNTVSVWLEDWAAAWNASLDEINTIINVNVRPLPAYCHIPSTSKLCRPLRLTFLALCSSTM